jgi:trimethylguanosine synthase
MGSHWPKDLTSKLWARRYELFSQYDKGIEIPTDLWSNLIPEVFAEHMSSRFAHCKVIETYCGAGSLTVQLAKHNHVTAIDSRNVGLVSARHNAEV